MCGFYELNEDGTILYSRIKTNGKFEKAEHSPVGQNFFEDVFIGRNSEALRRRFKRFVTEGSSTENFTFDYIQNENTIPLKIMLVRAAEFSVTGLKGLIFVEVRRV